jgi:hypothetical protein
MPFKRMEKEPNERISFIQLIHLSEKTFVLQHIQNNLVLNLIKGFLKIKLKKDNFLFTVMTNVRKLKSPS